VSKYHAKPQVVDGIRFASQKEARRYVELKLLDKAGVIDGLILQPRFELCTWHGDHSRAPFVGVYVADFEYFEKGFKTPLYKWKKKHVEAQYGIRIVEI
jgi:hypothetical protein